MTEKKEQIKTTDIYQAAFLLALGSSVKSHEIVKELDKDVCVLTLTGESIKTHQQIYLTNQALVDPVLYQKAVNRIKDIVFKAVSQVKELSRNQGGNT
jgi:hypothetical protein